MKKITILALHLGFGGIEKYISTLCQILEEEYDINIICTYKVQNNPAFYFSDKIKINYLINDKPDNISLKVLIKKVKIFSIIKELLRRLKFKYQEQAYNIKAIRNLDTDILITTRIFHDRLVYKYLKNKHIKTIATEHNFHNTEKYTKDLFKYVSRFDYLILCSKELLKDYKKHFDHTKCVYIPNCVGSLSEDYTNFSGKNIISVARFSEEKGLLDLIDVFDLIHKQDKKIKLYLLGDGYQRDEIALKIKAKHLDNSIVMPGFVDTLDQYNYYMDSSIYVMTSFTEAFGLVLIEAMNYGLPCIAFDCASGPRELLEDKKYGILISNRNKDKMAKEVVALINDKTGLKVYQKAVLKYVNNFSIEKIKEEWIKLLK
ncbi:MAG: glycosyltransferase [Bacilli bacterium]